MKDLSKLEILTKKPEFDENNPEKSKKPTSNKKKKIIIIAIVCLLGIAVCSKLINKHLKKERAQAEQQASSNKSTSSKQTNSQKLPPSTTDNKPQQNSELSKKAPKHKMVFTFYNSLKHDNVIVNTTKEKQRAKYKYTYIYQIASFRNMDETKYYVEKIEKIGLKPKFKQVGDWIRMYIGPYNNTRAVETDVIKLQRIGLNGGFTRVNSKTKIEPKKDKIVKN